MLLGVVKNTHANTANVKQLLLSCRQALASKKGASAAITAPTAVVVAAAGTDGEQPVDNYNPLLQGCRSIEHYERIKYINEGAYGMVFAARNRVTGEVVAIKQVTHINIYMHFTA
jgi:serine/threonine protein kinase